MNTQIFNMILQDGSMVEEISFNIFWKIFMIVQIVFKVSHKVLIIDNLFQKSWVGSFSGVMDQV